MKPKGRPAAKLEERLKRLAESVRHDGDRQALIHDLQVYQEELKVQNEALHEALAELEATRDQFIELYDFAPNGYLTLDPNGVIKQINLTGAIWLEKNKRAIEGLPLLGFVARADRDRALDFLRHCRQCKSGEVLTIDVNLRSADAARMVQLLCGPKRGAIAAHTEFFVSMIDVTELRRLEMEREQLAHARAALAGRLITIQEDERQRIARDLHDNVGQRLTALRLKLEALEMASAQNADVRPSIAEAQKTAEQLDAALDYIVAGQRPAMLDVGLVAALEQLVNDWSNTFLVRAEVHANGLDGLRLGPDIEPHLYRIVQEALNNIYKHANARSATVILERRRDHLVLIVEDDGCGFGVETELIDRRRQLGLIGMRERAQLMGGTLEIESAPGRGTTVFLEIPGRFA